MVGPKSGGGYQNPLRRAHVTSERIDQGVDYSGSGPIYALGPGVIKQTLNSGWPGGTFIAEQLTGGPNSGQYVYYAENITPTVTVGQRVGPNDVVGNIRGGIEIGWASPPPNLGNTMAFATGESRKGLSEGDPGKYETGFGVAFSNLIKSLGGPGGTKGGLPVQGKAPPGRGGGGGTGPVTTTGSGGLLTGLGQGLIDALLSSLGVPSLGDAVKRLGLILLGGALIIMGLIALTKPSQRAQIVTTVTGKGGRDAGYSATSGREGINET